NKIDMIGLDAAAQKYDGISPIIFISAKEKIAVEDVKLALFDAAIDGSIQSENTIVTNARHHVSLVNVVNSLNEVEQGMEMGLSGELLAIDIRRSLHFLGEITGQVEIDRDILGTIFGKFCIGK